MISFKHVVHYYYYRLKRKHGLNQVVYIAIVNQFMGSLTHVVLYFNFSTKRQQSSNPVVHVFTFSKKTTWFQSSSPEFHFPKKESVVQTN